ncbi:hypothetical protein GLOIN_2v1506170 [Rhizophagus irregularis DAOM 181602=DAOM 197198]|uniref:Uncharacterized protein n=1 Tax=Rhizophagus irregularis (strain DAOM 181602 / DAOM 197198 / MUCL 43194) TaxID=747089 RepID=A0A2P4QV68_RHIID|nr:hypothetical protein GLOIN_2v1506170 [Rhizophagus irregularis DAOM 181602=DAOM 197198]POG81541.1 hypothetical protein GLOIN_2v1506170 [Rhizophagus irregularis DAOM 181602=DAOM 197198]|eukprot:XP_025188407.1 hypothetical protein GLOIN_2v1506170 [Rhizophagus irregularis DAOM 181602=DAOM 197198]
MAQKIKFQIFLFGKLSIDENNDFCMRLICTIFSKISLIFSRDSYTYIYIEQKRTIDNLFEIN